MSRDIQNIIKSCNALTNMTNTILLNTKEHIYLKQSERVKEEKPCPKRVQTVPIMCVIAIAKGRFPVMDLASKDTRATHHK
jgi:hypothetical protein